ncbi:MAG: hypothetical protein ACYCTL_10485 [Acidimicrobiales bacterium]
MRWSDRGALTRRNLVVALGVIWILDGVLQFQPYMYSSGFFHSLLGQTVTPLLIRLTYGSVTARLVCNTLAALLQIGIGAGLLYRRSEKVALGASFAWGVLVWIAGEKLGGLISPGASMAIGGAPGAALVYSLLSLMLWPRRPAAQTAAPSRPAGEMRPAGEVRSAGERAGLLGRRGALALWAAIWAGTGLLELERSNYSPRAITAQIAAQAPASGMMARMDSWFVHAASGSGTVIAIALLVVQLGVGLGVLWPSTRKLALAGGMGASVVFWVVGQNFGGILSGGQATDPNLGPLMVLFALVLWGSSVVSASHRGAAMAST